MKCWIARDRNGRLYLHRQKPQLFSKAGIYDSDDWWDIDSEEYPEVTFENSPREIELKLV